MNERLSELQAEKDRREKELVKLYRPTEFQEPIFRTGASELLITGGKRSGKSMTAAVLFGSRVTGEPIKLADGTVIESAWPISTPEEPQVFWIIGYATDHIGQTIHRLLFERGQGAGAGVRCLRDAKTGEWRLFNPAIPEDEARKEESELCEPVIPSRLIDHDSWVWENKGARVFESVRLKNGALICAFPSSARNAKQGEAVSGIWIDEDIQNPAHLSEWQDRLTNRGGWFMWSVWPHRKNDGLIGLMERAAADQVLDDPQIQSFQLLMTDNPFIPEKAKEEALKRMGTDEQVARRNRGDLLLDSMSMYQFSNSANTIQRPRDREYEVYKLPPAHVYLRDLWFNGNGFPAEWTRYLSIDPSNTRTACHSWVIPPFEVSGMILGNIAIAEWELIAKKFSATKLAETLEQMMGNRNYEAFIMDKMAGRQTHAGREENTFGVYSEAFRCKGIYSRQTNFSFVPGCNVRQTRFRAVRQMLDFQRANGLPGMMIVEEKCPETKREFNNYMRKVEGRHGGIDDVLDEPQNPRLYDCMASVEYFAAYIEPMFMVDRAYIPPENYRARGSVAYHAYQNMMKKRRDKDKQGAGDAVYIGTSS